jgi:nucleoside-diphosphate-sugar epimerase
MILVTGGAGLIGSALLQQLLQQGKKVRALVHHSPVHQEGVEFFQGDILDVVSLEEAMNGISEVYHCAGLVSYAPGMDSTLYKINVEGTANIVNVALDMGIRKLVHVSSVATLNSNDNPITENSKWVNARNKTAYAQSKYFGEMEVWRAMAEGLNAVIVNPSIVLGEGDWDKGSTAMFKSAYNEFPWFTNGVTGYVDAKDVAKAMILLMESNISEERFVLSSTNASYYDIFSQMAKAFNKKPPHKKATPLLSGLVWRFERFKSFFTGKTPLLTKETAHMAFSIQHYNGNKITQYIPQFSYRPIDETISRVAQALQHQLNIH